MFSWATLGHYLTIFLIGCLLFGRLCSGVIRRVRADGLGLRWWAALGLLLAVLPVPILCLCTRYQGAFDYGYGYLPVYIQYFGVALVLAGGVGMLGRGPQRLPAGVLAAAPALLFAAFTVVDYAANVQVTHAVRSPLPLSSM